MSYNIVSLFYSLSSSTFIVIEWSYTLLLQISSPVGFIFSILLLIRTVSLLRSIYLLGKDYPMYLQKLMDPYVGGKMSKWQHFS